MAKEGEKQLQESSLCFPSHSQMLPGSLKREDARKQVKTIFFSFAIDKQVWSSYGVPGTLPGAASTGGPPRSLAV